MALREILMERYKITATRVGMAERGIEFCVFTWHRFDPSVPVVLAKTTQYFTDAVRWIAEDRGLNDLIRKAQFITTLEDLYICGSDDL